MNRREFVGALVAAPVVWPAEEWTPLFDGKSLDGWKASENAGSWKVVDGTLAADGPRSHLFYTAREFRDFELEVELMTRPGANSGVYFHSAYQEQGWPEKGFEVQVNNTHVGEGSYRERKKTGSLYGVRNVYKAFAKDDEWFRMHIAVRGPRVEVRVNGVLLVDWVEPRNWTGKNRIGAGLFALQGHDAHSKVFCRNIRVRELPNTAAFTSVERPVADEIDAELVRLGAANYPVVDWHVHLKGGLTLEDALREQRRTGIQYGIAVNCGLGFPIHDDAGARNFLESVKGQPVFVALQGEGREWLKLVSRETLAGFDYAFTDAMTFTDDSGKRMRLWIPKEVGEIGDKQRFMDMYVDRIVGVLTNEPIDIHVNPTFLPDAIAAEYDALWTEARMKKVIEAAANRGIAIEINNRYKIPSASFIKLAKQAGVKFAWGTNNDGRELGRCEYGIRMVRECGLGWQDFWVPRPIAL